jgi:hypothetical protein
MPHKRVFNSLLAFAVEETSTSSSFPSLHGPISPIGFRLESSENNMYEPYYTCMIDEYGINRAIRPFYRSPALRFLEKSAQKSSGVFKNVQKSPAYVEKKCAKSPAYVENKLQKSPFYF